MMSPGTIKCGIQNAERGMADQMKTASLAGVGLYTLHSELRNQTGRILQSKGFAGGVPLNTERAAVKPRVGIAR